MHGRRSDDHGLTLSLSHHSGPLLGDGALDVVGDVDPVSDLGLVNAGQGIDIFVLVFHVLLV